MDAKHWMKTWREAAPRLEAIRRDELRRTDHVRDVQLFDGVFEYAASHITPTTSSGLVEQQRLFGRIRRRA